MATKITINGKTTSIPNVYSTIQSGINNPPSPLAFGNVVIIDDGSLQTSVSGGIGVNGTNAQGVNSIYSFNTLQQFRSLIKDGQLYQLAAPLFLPNGNGINGANVVYYIKAGTTAPGTKTVTLSKATIAFTTNEEGTVVNGVLTPYTYNANTLPAPQNVNITPSTTGGTLAAGTHYYKITAINANGQTIASPQVSATTTGTTSSISLTWGAVTGATTYAIYKGTSPSTINTFITTNTNSFIDDNSLTFNSGVPPTTNTAIDGTLTSNELARGYGIRVEKGKAFGYSLAFYKGITSNLQDTFNNNVPTYWDGTLIPNDNAVPGVHGAVKKPTLLFRSPDCTNVRNLQTWLAKSADVRNLFKTVTVTYTGANQFDDALVAADASQYTALAPYSLIANATETFSSDDFDAAITAVTGLDNTFFLCLGYGDNASNVNNEKIFNLLTSGDLRYDKYMIVGGGLDSDGYQESIDTAQGYDSQHVIVTHAGGILSDTRQPNNQLIVSQLYKAANILGRIGGLEPQTPVTFKQIAIDADLHSLTEDEKQTLIDAGVTYTNYDNELNAFVVGYGLTTLQDNDNLVDEDGNSYDIAVERIKSQLNKEIIINAKKRFFGGNTGANRNTVSPAEIQAWLGGFLTLKTAKPNQDNLILRWDNIVVTQQEDNLYVTYEFVPNLPVSKIIFTGVMLDK